MISVTEARKIIGESVAPLRKQRVPISEALGLTIAEDILSPVNLPSFRQSSMDGYAIRHSDLRPGKKIKLSGLSQAGRSSGFKLKKDTAARIFTGAFVPDGADTVVMQEKVIVTNHEILIGDENLKVGDNIRPVGMEIRKGELALQKNSVLTPAAIGFLATLGIDKVLVSPRPSICIIVTGNELRSPGGKLQPGEVYDANSYSLRAALDTYGFKDVKVRYAKDSLSVLTTTLKKALAGSDLVFLTGGVSVGDFDFVLQATINNRVTKLFHKIKQRPAKPLYFGKKTNKYIFGLPGNPASGLMSFYLYALPALGTLIGRDLSLKQLKAPLTSVFKKKPGLTTFLKGYYDGQSVTILNAQESFRLSSFAQGNCIVEIDELIEICNEGEMVQVYLID